MPFVPRRIAVFVASVNQPGCQHAFGPRRKRWARLRPCSCRAAKLPLAVAQEAPYLPGLRETEHVLLQEPIFLGRSIGTCDLGTVSRHYRVLPRVDSLTVAEQFQSHGRRLLPERPLAWLGMLPS
jgi:hypothetical protein